MEEIFGDHPHCQNCIKWAKCTVPEVAGQSCKIINCPLDCGARYHACKDGEHRHLCMNEKVSCINAEYGCPSTMLRKYRSKHLPSCPASIVYCSIEWDRWPIHFHKKSHIQSPSELDPTLKGQLDLSLAMRDQRMLRRWCYAASHGMPLSDQKFTISPSSSLWIFRKWQGSREYSFPPGLQQSVCIELCKTCKKKFGTAPTHCVAKTFNLDASLKGEDSDCGELSDKENSGDSNNIQINVCDQDSSNKTKIVNRDNPLEKSISEIKELPQYNLDDVLQLSQFGTLVYNQNSGERSIHVAVDPADSYYLSSCFDHKNIACQILDMKFRNPSSIPPWCLSLGLDINLESRSQHPPSNFMYTFLCSQEFRRDQYGWHYKNVHSEIHGGLNGWLIERCPLAQYGCTFSRRRFKPAALNSNLVYNECLESFGVTQTPDVDYEKIINSKSSQHISDKSEEHSMSLLDLPFDVLRHVAHYLDSFSLANISMTSTLLRDVCSTILKEKGLVHLIWERHKLKDGTCKWRVAEKKWFFSSHFSPIHQWSMEESDNMSNHLKSCPYFNRLSQKKAFGYEHPKNSDPPHDKRFCDPLGEPSEHNTTKL